MKPCLVIFTFGQADEMNRRHYPFWERSECDIMLSFPYNDGSALGGFAFGKSERFGAELMRRTFATFKHVLRLGHDLYFFIESDAVILGKLPRKLEGGLHAFLYQNEDPRFTAAQYCHWMWGANRNTLTKLALMGERYAPDCELGFPDRTIGLICEETGIPMHHRDDLSFSCNRIDTPELVAAARNAIASGVKAVHGVKTQSDLQAIGLA